MEYRKFGPTDLTVSVLGFGCYEYAGGEYGDKMAAAIRSALDRGVLVSIPRLTMDRQEAESPNFCWAGPWARVVKTW